MRSGLKSFVKVMDIPATDVSSMDFKDSAGTQLPCNYFSVQCRNVSGFVADHGHFPEHGYFFVAPSSTTTLYGASLNPSTTTAGGAGAGGVAGTADATVEMSLLPPDRATGLTIYNSLGSKGRFVIIYGNIAVANPQRDANTDLYPRGS